jgi:hypothetical protein
MTTLLALFLLAHGLAHVAGFVAAWQLGDPQKIPHITTILGGRVDVGETGIRAIGVLWLLVGLAFVAVGGLALFRFADWRTAALAVSVVSLLMCLVGWPEARVGLLLNAVLVLGLALALRSQLGAVT